MQYFANGIAQVLFSLTVIELARPGQESTTYELLISVSNAASKQYHCASVTWKYRHNNFCLIFSSQHLHVTSSWSYNSGTASSIISTQLLTPLKAAGCTNQPCSTGTVDITDTESFEASNGPWRFTTYSLTLIAISVTSSLLFTPFLPKNKEQCHEWQLRGQLKKGGRLRGYAVLALSVATITVSRIPLYILACILYLDHHYFMISYIFTY